MPPVSNVDVDSLFLQVRVTNLQDASEHIGEVLKRVKKEHLVRAYKISDWYTQLYAIGLEQIVLIIIQDMQMIYFFNYMPSY